MIILKGIIFFLFLTSINGYKILLYNPKYGHSHINFMSQITKLLVNAGHDVVVISSNIDPTLKDPYHLPGKIYYAKPSELIVEVATSDEQVKNKWEVGSNILGHMSMIQKVKDAIRDQGLTIFNNKELEEFVVSGKFDLAIGEGMHIYMFGLFKAWGIEKTIVATSMAMFDQYYTIFGIPFPTSYVPSAMFGSHDKMSYKERAKNLLTHIFMSHFIGMFSDYTTLKDVFDEKYGEEFYSPKILTEASFILINSNPFLDIPTPKSPKMIEISGIGKPKPKPLDKEFNEILNRRNKTILISFGSMAKSSHMDQDMKDGILDTIKSFPDITFIWKYETPEDGHGKGIENLVLSKWVPQNDLLSDKRLTLFITHGGMGSTTECNKTDYGHVNVTLKDASNLNRPGTKLRIGEEGDVHWNWQDESISFIPYIEVSHNCTKGNERHNCWKSFVLNFTNITPEETGRQRTPTINFGNKELTDQSDDGKCKKENTNNELSNHPPGADVVRHSFNVDP
uniref:glucuronosyltransferase n=1 Tax=Parastrongyloides trichosuri TaxID=131310 RepID=A0A0N4ZL23_PARTI